MSEGTGTQPGRDAYEILEVRPDSNQVVVKAAFRALAAIYHPDAVGGSSRRMAELNEAYALVRTTDLRAAYDRLNKHHAIPVQPATTVAAGPIQAAAGAAGKAYGETKRAGVIDFGRYEGWSIADLARRDPDYLRWLRRHSSGIRFRNEIDAILAKAESREPAESRRR